MLVRICGFCRDLFFFCRCVWGGLLAIIFNEKMFLFFCFLEVVVDGDCLIRKLLFRFSLYIGGCGIWLVVEVKRRVSFSIEYYIVVKKLFCIES